MPGMPKVLILGASGVVGSAALERFLQSGDWDVVAASRRKPEISSSRPYRHISVDLQDAGASREAFGALTDVTHVVYAALFEKPGLMEGWKERDQMETNLRMLQNVIGPLTEASNPLEHVSVLQGTKAYGIHLEPIAVPARERAPRHQHENFYWLQEDYIREQAAEHGFAWTVFRPQLILGGSLAAPMNMVAAIGVYGAICREEGIPFGHPGGGPWVWQVSDSRIVASALEWAATAQTSRNEIFNVTNGEACDWRDLWPSFCETLGLENPGDTPRLLSEFLPAHAETWDRIVEKHGLRPLSLHEVVGESHHFADFMFLNGTEGQQPPALMSDIKIRQAGFGDFMDTEESFRYWLNQLVERNVLPAADAAAGTERAGALTYDAAP